MIVEHAILDVKPNEAAAYEVALQWKALLHPCYSPFPLVEHFGDAVAQR